MTDRSSYYVAAGVGIGAVLLLVIAYAVGRCSAPHPIDPILYPGDVDAGPGEAVLAAALDGAVRAEEARLEAIEREHAAEIEEFTAEETAEFEARRADRRALAIWFKDRTLRILDAGVTR